MKLNYFITFIFITLFIVPSYSQKGLKKKKNKISKNEYEIYWTFKNEPDTKQGEYSYYKNKTLRVHGYYIDNKKDSIWEIYSYKGKKIKTSKYKNGVKNGLSEEYTYPFGFTNYKYKISKGVYKNNKKVNLWITYKFYPNNKLVKISQGYYNNGYKNGSFVYYEENGITPLAVGKYKNDTMISKWNFYNKGTLLQIYDFNNDTLIYNKIANVSKINKIENGKYKDLIFVEKKPIYKSGLFELYKFFQNNIIIPEEAYMLDIKGTLIVSLKINANTSISNIKIIKGLGYGIDAEFLRMLKLTSDDWIPAHFNNVSVTTELKLKINLRVRETTYSGMQTYNIKGLFFDPN